MLMSFVRAFVFASAFLDAAGENVLENTKKYTYIRKFMEDDMKVMKKRTFYI